MKNDGQTQRGHRRDSQLKAISCQNLSVSYSQLKGRTKCTDKDVEFQSSPKSKEEFQEGSVNIL